MKNAIAELEAPAETAVVVHPQQQATLFRTDDPSQIVERASVVATSLKAVIVKQGLVSNIRGKEYPRCEAWTLLGTMLGVFPVLAWSRKVEEGWEARVEAKTRDGATVGAAEAECLRSEDNWSSRDDFALRSMAQTRATAKALRMPLGFIMTLAGYEATPAEEMSQETANAAQQRPNVPKQDKSAPNGDWRAFPVPFGKNAGKSLGSLTPKQLAWYVQNFEVQTHWEDTEGRKIEVKPDRLARDRDFRAMLDLAAKDMSITEEPGELYAEAGTGDDTVPF